LFGLLALISLRGRQQEKEEGGSPKPEAAGPWFAVAALSKSPAIFYLLSSDCPASEQADAGDGRSDVVAGLLATAPL
jgi:hypothetical protein